MNKVLLWIKNILFVILTFLIISASIKFKYIDIIYSLLYVLFIIVNLRDIISKNKINKDKLYNTISVLALIIMSFIYARVLYDSGFLHNSEIIKSYNASSTYQIPDFTVEAIMFIRQNMIPFIITLLLLFMYRFINVRKIKKEYFSASLIFMILSIVSIIPSIYVITQIDTSGRYLNAAFSLCYLVVTLTLVGIEVFRFIQKKYKDKMNLLYITLAFNLFAIIVCAIQLHYTFKFWA